MYKSASNLQSSAKRTASHATKPLASGRVDILPPKARELEIIYNEHKEQVVQLEKSLAAAASRRQKNRIKSEIGRARGMARSVGEEAYATTFYVLAALRMPNELFRELDIETRNAMGRLRHELKRDSRPNKRTSLV